MCTIIIGIIGLLLIVADYGPSTLVGAGIFILNILVFAAVSLFKENTGDAGADLAVLHDALGGTATDQKGQAVPRHKFGAGTTIRFTANGQACALNVYHVGHSSASNVLKFDLTMQSDTDMDIRVGDKTFLRGLDRYFGADCVFYGAKAGPALAAQVFVAGKDRDDQRQLFSPVNDNYNSRFLLPNFRLPRIPTRSLMC